MLKLYSSISFTRHVFKVIDKKIDTGHKLLNYNDTKQRLKADSNIIDKTYRDENVAANILSVTKYLSSASPITSVCKIYK